MNEKTVEQQNGALLRECEWLLARRSIFVPATERLVRSQVIAFLPRSVIGFEALVFVSLRGARQKFTRFSLN